MSTCSTCDRAERARERAAEAAMRAILPPRGAWPRHAVTKLRMTTSWYGGPHTWALGGWQAWDRRWWAFARRLQRTGHHREDRAFSAARIYLNGGGRDPELRVEVIDLVHGDGFNPDLGIANTFRRGIEELEQSPLAGRLYGSRGVYRPLPGDVRILMDWCDRRLAELYAPYRL